jgi:hypothetical protein
MLDDFTRGGRFGVLPCPARNNCSSFRFPPCCSVANTSITMSSTTTQTQTRTRQNVLKDYELHHSASSSRAAPTSPAVPAPTPQAVLPNQPEWDTVHRRVPPYRPINRERDQSEVRVYTSTIERVFIGTMFTGVLINSVSIIHFCGHVRSGVLMRHGGRRRPRSGEERLGGSMTECSNIPSAERYRDQFMYYITYSQRLFIFIQNTH